MNCQAGCFFDQQGQVDAAAANKKLKKMTKWQLVPIQTITLEEARAGQDWKGMDGACAWRVIDRHAEGWGEVGLMMQAWLEANIPDGEAK